MGNCAGRKSKRKFLKSMNQNEFVIVANMYLMISANKLQKVFQMEKKFKKHSKSLSDSEFSELKSLYLELIKYGEILQSYSRDLHDKKLKIEGNRLFEYKAIICMEKIYCQRNRK